MGADWGLYSALRGQDNWAQKRQDKMQNLMMLERRESKAQQELEKQAQLEQGMQSYFDEISKLDALAEDQGRIQEEEKKARRNIYKGIAAVNGNLKSYMSTGGISALSEYRRTILNSDSVKNAALNKVNMSNFIKDKSEGKYIKRVDVDIPVMENGKPKLDKNGNPVTKRENITMEEEIQLFRDGVINKLTYNGAERKVKLDPLKFSKTTKNPADPYTAYAVTTDDIYNYAIEQGASKEYANEVAVEYGKSKIKSKQPWYWGTDDKYADMEKAAKAAKYSSSSSGRGGGVRQLNQIGPKLRTLAIAAKKTGQDMPQVLGTEDADFFRKFFSLKTNTTTNASGGFKRNIVAIDPTNGRRTVLDNALDLKLGDKYVVRPDGRKYLEASVVYKADEPIEGNPHKENLIGYNGLVDEESRRNWQFRNIDETNLRYDKLGLDDGEDVVTGTVYLDVTDPFASQIIQDQINKEVGITSQFDGAAASSDSYEQEYNTSTQENEVKNQIKEQYSQLTQDEVNQIYALTVRNRQ